MKRININARFLGRLLLTLFVCVLALTLLTGCEEAGAGSNASDDNGVATDDGGGESSPDDDGEENAGGDDAGSEEESGNNDDAEGGAEVTLDTSDLLLHMGFDGDLSDESGTSSNMTVIDDQAGTTTAVYGEDRDGTSSAAIEFDGSRFLRISDIDLSDQDSITLTAWIRDDGSATTTDRWIASYVSGANTVEFALRIRLLGQESWQDGSFEAFVENSGSNGTRTTENVFPGSWVHVAMVYDASAGEMRLYQDGERKNSATVSLDIAAGNLIIGGGSGSNQDFHGLIDDVALFPRALTDAEIALAKDEIVTD